MTLPGSGSGSGSHSCRKRESLSAASELSLRHHSLMGTDRLLTSREVANLLGLKNEKTLAVWRCTGRHDLPYVKYGRSVRYRESDIQQFVADRLILGWQHSRKG
jgi:excisionase family DNA binding protein